MAKHRLLLIFVGVALVAVASLPFILSASCVTRPQTTPYQDCTETDYKQWLSEMPAKIDWTDLQAYEFEDTTTGTQSLSCTASNCEIVDVGSVK